MKKMYIPLARLPIHVMQKITRLSLLLFFLCLSFTKGFAQTTLNAGDIAIIGFNTDKSPDDIAILVLKDLSAGTVFYVNDNEVLTAGGTSFADLNEAEASFTVKPGQSIPAGTVLVLPWGGGLTSTTTYDWSVTSGAGLGNAEEIYIYTAASITSATPTGFIFGVTQGSNTGLRPNGLTTGTTWIDHGTSRAYRYNTSGATYSGTQAQLLTAIGNTANYTGAGTYNFAPTDWTFTVNAVGGTPSVNLSVSASSGGESGATAITVTATASGAVTGDQTVSLAVTGMNITTGDYTLSNTTITIPNGLTTGTATFTIVDDALVEGTETATVTISNPSEGITLGAITAQDISIIDNDAAIPHTLAFVRTDTTVSENAGTGRVWLKVTSVGNVAGTVDLAISNYSTATGSGVDYAVPVTLNIPANLVLNQLISFDFTITDDGIAEPDEYIICKLINASNVTVSSTAQSTLYIKDNDKAAPVASNQLNLNFVTSFSNGASGINSAEISAYDAGSKRLFIANSVANKLDIVDLSNPASPVLVSSIDLSSFNGSINSVAVNNGVAALALEGLTDKQANGKIVFVNTNGGFISEVAAGAMPDMITFNHAGTKVYTANEGEPNAAYTIDPTGSITIADLSNGAASATSVTIDFTAFNGQEASLRSQGIRIYGLNASAAQDFEPEYITISDDDTKAWVTLQENNALAELDLTNNTIVKLIPLGYKNYSLPENTLDASDQTFGVNFSNYPVKGMYLPDAIASYTSGGNIYLVTANEGDSRAYTGFNEESRVSGLTLDPTVFPNSAELKNNAVLGRLNATNKTGDIDNDGDIDEIYVYGGRSFSIWNPANAAPLVYDSKDEMERITFNDPLYSSFFNMSNGVGAGTLKNRSDDKGPEPEGVTTAKIGGRDYAFIALERIGGVMAYDITNPATPSFVNYANNRTATDGDRGAEGIIFIPASQSPNGKNLVLLSNEVSSTVSIYEIATCAAPGIATIASTQVGNGCNGNTKLYSVNSDSTYTYQWFKNDSLLIGATDSVYIASQTGDYKLVVFNTTGCADTSDIVSVTIASDTTAPTIAAPANVSTATNSGCVAAGINLGTPTVADNCAVATISNDAPASFSIGTTTVTWTVTDSSGNSASATQIVTVSDTLKPVVYLQQSSLLNGITGNSSSQSPYLIPSKTGIQFKSILTTGDAAGGYKMSGIPDGLGAFDNNDGTFTLLMNHELGNTLGVTRAHGSKGSFVSKWIINKTDLSVMSGSDLMQQVYLWDTTAKTFNPGTIAFSRFCSADLPAPSAFFNSKSGKGTSARIFMNGEESGVEGKAVGHIVTGPDAGKSYELPYLGKFAWENSVASPASGDKTVVAGFDDGTGGQVYVYVGNKTTTGTEIDKAGLNNGKLYGIKVTGFTAETSASFPAAGTRFEMADLGFVQNKTGAVLNTESVAAGVMTFLRPEDGAWDPSNPNDLYFNTTNAFNSPTRVWRLRFDDIKNPELGGTIEAVINGTEAGQQMFDNMAVDGRGHLLLQEDVGNNAHLGKIWQYNIAADSLFPIAYHDSTRFITGAPNFLTQDEESSGAIDVSDILGQGTFLTVVQSHKASSDAELVEGGQLLAFFNPYTLNGVSTASDTVKIAVPFGTASTTVNLGTPATADNCSVSTVTNNAPATFPVGTTNVTWMATDASGNVGTAVQTVIVTINENAPPAVSITSPAANTTFNAGNNITVQVNAEDNDGSVSKVDLYVNGSLYGTDSIAPYTFSGTNVEEGVYNVVATATDSFGASASTDTLTITVKGCKPTGSVNAEGFLAIQGDQVADLLANSKYPNSPDITAQLTTLEYANVADSYGGRLYGYICAPLTGYYTFYISGNDQAGLWLSTDDKPANKVLIAYTETATNFRDYYRFPTQKSVSIYLVKGARYYFETLQKEATGQDHLSVAWKLPNGSLEAPIGSSRISPYGSLFGRPAFVEAMRTAPQSNVAAKELTVSVLPNPSTSEFTLMLRSNSDEKVVIRILDIHGRSLETIKGANSNGTAKAGRRLLPGVYFAEVTQGNQRRIIKMVKE